MPSHVSYWSRQSVFMTFLYGSVNSKSFDIRSAHYLYDMVNDQKISDWQLQPLLKDTSNRFIGPVQVNFPNYQAYYLHSEADTSPIISDRKTPKQVLGVSFIIRDLFGTISATGNHDIVFLESIKTRVTQYQIDAFVVQSQQFILDKYSNKLKKPVNILKSVVYCSDIFY